MHVQAHTHQENNYKMQNSNAIESYKENVLRAQGN